MKPHCFDRHWGTHPHTSSFLSCPGICSSVERDFNESPNTTEMGWRVSPAYRWLEIEDRACVIPLTVHKDRLKGVSNTMDVMRGCTQLVDDTTYTVYPRREWSGRCVLLVLLFVVLLISFEPLRLYKQQRPLQKSVKRFSGWTVPGFWQTDLQGVLRAVDH